MARQRDRSRHRDAPSSVTTCDPRCLPHRPLQLDIIRRNDRSIGAMKYIPMCTSFFFVVEVSPCLFFVWQTPTCTNLSSPFLSIWTSRFVLSARYRFQRGLFDARSPVWVTHRWIRRSHCSGPAPCMLLMLMYWAISQTRSLTALSIRCVVNPPLSCEMLLLSAAHWLTPTLEFSA